MFTFVYWYLYCCNNPMQLRIYIYLYIPRLACDIHIINLV